ncbi:MAG: glutaredoxin [Oligoflexia bacterium]|nr:glutaredoxin [Oligoflexia bacterium]
MSTPKLEYFYFDACPFCQKVLRVIQSTNIKVEYKDIMSDMSSLERLVNDTGRRTVPCLYIDNMPMHESDDIIHWIEENVDKLEKNS